MEACLPRRTRCKGARTRRRHAFSTGSTVVRDRTTSTATTKTTTMRTRTRTTATISAYYRVVLVRSGAEAPHPSCSNVSLCLEQLASLSSPPARHHHGIPTSLPLRSCLIPCYHPLPSGGTMLTDGSRPTYHRHPHVQNPASGVNVPEFPRVSLLNMHLLRAPGRGGPGVGGNERTGAGGTGGATGFFLSFPMLATGMRDDSIRHHVAHPPRCTVNRNEGGRRRDRDFLLWKVQRQTRVVSV